MNIKQHGDYCVIVKKRYMICGRWHNERCITLISLSQEEITSGFLDRAEVRRRLADVSFLWLLSEITISWVT